MFSFNQESFVSRLFPVYGNSRTISNKSIGELIVKEDYFWMESFSLYLFGTLDNNIKCVLSFHIVNLMHYNLASICSISFIYFKLNCMNRCFNGK